MVGNLFGFRRQGRIDIGLQQFGSRVPPPLKRGMTPAAFQSLGISDDTKERFNRLVIEVAAFFRTSAIWIWVKEGLLWRVPGN
jgi:hypothetical protein